MKKTAYTLIAAILAAIALPPLYFALHLRVLAGEDPELALVERHLDGVEHRPGSMKGFSW